MDARYSLHPQPSTILPAKIRPPGTREKRVERHHLLDRLNADEAKMCIVVAPAGSGKTTLLSQWAETRMAATGWISLSREDNVLSGFLVSLVASLGEIDARLVNMIDASLAAIGATELHTCATVILQTISQHPDRWALILDDYHAIDDSEVHDFLVELVGAMPPHCRLIVASRIEPPIPVARLRILEDLTSITTNELRATVAESRELLRIYGVDATEQQLIALADFTTGWMVAIHLVALASRTTPLEQVITSLSTFKGQLDLLGDFLFYEVLCQQSPELRDFLLKISILERFTAECCYAVTNEGMAMQLLDQVRRSGLFLLDLDAHGTWLSLRNPFRDFLRHRLHLEFPPTVVLQLHVAASAWYWRSNLSETAIIHAIQAEDWSAATRMITSVATEMFLQHRLRELGVWMQSFPRDLVLTDPDLSSLMAYVMVRQGRMSESEPFLVQAEQRWQTDGLVSGLALIALIRADEARAREEMAGLIAHAARSIELVTDAPVLSVDGRILDIQPRLIVYRGTWMAPLPQMNAYGYLAHGLVRAGRLTEAEPLIQRMQTAYETAGIDVSASSLTPVLAQLHLARGRLLLAEAVARPFARPVLDNRPTGRATACDALAEVLYQWNRIGEAKEAIDDGLNILRNAGWTHNVLGLSMQAARIQWLSGNVDEANAALTDAYETAMSLRNLSAVRDVDAMRVQIAMATGDLDRARRWAMARSHGPDMNIDAATIFELLVFVRLLIATGEAETALPLLRRLREALVQHGRNHDLIKVLVTESIVRLDLFELDQAVETLGMALTIGEAGGYRRVFLDEGAPMLRLLRIAHRRGLAVGYIRELLLAAGETPGEVVRMTHRELIEPITAREIEVLGLVTLGLTNKEISDELYLSLATVKRHITNLYGKLGVSSRTEAVQRARRLGLLSSEQPAARPSPTGVPVD